MESNFYNQDMPIGAFIEACKQRLGYVEGQLRSLQEERHHLVQFLGVYGQLQQSSKTMHIQPSSIPPAPSARLGNQLETATAVRLVEEAREKRDARLRTTVDNSANEQILARVAGLLSDGRKKTTELVALLNSIGLRLNSPNQQALLSTLMSKDERFVASRKFGWGLKGRDDADGEPEEEE